MLAFLVLGLLASQGMAQDQPVIYKGLSAEQWKKKTLDSPVFPDFGSPFLTKPDAGAIPLFRVLLKDREPPMFGMVVLTWVMALKGDSKPLVGDIMQILNDEKDDGVLAMALRALNVAEPDAKKKELVALKYRDHDSNSVRLQAFEILAAKRPTPDKDVADVVAIIESKETDIFEKKVAVLILGKMDWAHPQVFSEVCRYVYDRRDKAGIVRRSAIVALGNATYNLRSVEELLTHLLSDEDIEIKADAACSLFQLTHKTEKSLSIIADVANDIPFGGTQSRIIDTLAVMARTDKKAYAVLEAMGKKDWIIRKQVEAALAELKKK